MKRFRQGEDQYLWIYNAGNELKAIEQNGAPYEVKNENS